MLSIKSDYTSDDGAGDSEVGGDENGICICVCVCVFSVCEVVVVSLKVLLYSGIAIASMYKD
jgi:hypothetical protein